MPPLLRLLIPRGCRVKPPSVCAFSFTPTVIPRHLRRSLEKSLQQRCYSQPAVTTKPNRIEEELKRQARAAAKNGGQYEIPEKLIIYHAGTGRTTFLAMVKITTLFLGAFFCFIATPGYIKAEKPELETAGVALCGIIPVLFVAFTTSPFVTHIHIHLPPYARTSRAILERFVRTMPPATPLTLTTMSAISKPRYSTVKAGDLVPTRRRFGLVNYVRDTAEENARRRWYMFRAVGNFYLQERQQAASKKARHEKSKKGVVHQWIWDAIREKLSRKAQARSV